MAQATSSCISPPIPCARWNDTAPLSTPLGLDSEATRRHIALATGCLVVLGILVRLLRYSLKFPLWGDESALAANFLDRGYLDLLRPLDFQQVAPPLFLWIELAIVRLFGFNEWTLRAFPCVCSVASVLLFRHVAGRLLTGVPLLLAVGIFSVAYYPVRLGAEVKQYASDLLVSLVLLAIAFTVFGDRLLN